MTADEIDAFLSIPDKQLPFAPDWRRGNRADESRATLPIEAWGGITRVKLEIIVRLGRPDYMIVVLLAPKCFVRLCMGTPHRDAISRDLVLEPHWHPWHLNRRGNGVPARLDRYELVPAEQRSRDEAFAWFLDQTGIESPRWLPVIWPGRETLV